ncbi:hypothetical protein GCM10023221_12490 [Luteimicrobium xylanilyticum]
MRDGEDPPVVAHVPMAFSPQASTLMTVVQRLGDAYREDLGGTSYAVLSDNRGVSVESLGQVYVDYTRACPRQWFTRRELGVDVVAGGIGRPRPHYGRLYDPAIEAVAERGADVVLLYEGHYASASLPRWREALPDAELCLYVHNPLSRTYRRRELSRLLRAADRVVFCADHLREDVRRRTGGALTDRLEVVHNGVGAPFVTNARRTAPQDAFVVLFVGRVAEHKGVHLVLDAAEQAAAKLERPVVVEVAGSADYGGGTGDSAYSARLRERAAHMSVSVRWLGWLDEGALAAKMHGAGAACLPSLWAEGLPTAALQSLAMGTPVVCSDSAGMVEAVGDAGLVCKNASVDELARALVTLASDDALWLRTSELSRQQAAQFSWTRASAMLAGIASEPGEA